MTTFKFEKTITEIIEIPLEACYVCGKKDVSTHDCGYSSFNVCSVKCNHCDRTIKLLGDYTKQELIEYWNAVNGDLTNDRKLEILRNQIIKLRETPLV